VIELATVTADLRAGVLAIAPLPSQEIYSGHPSLTLRAAEVDPDRRPVAIVEDGTPVGFFVLERGGSEPAVPGGLLLRGFFVDAAAQGRGVATRALAGLASFVRRHEPDARRVVLTVNVENPAAITVYRRAGFADRGELYNGGLAGPQHVLQLDV
jgi:RimJ/RimL family protein N-acetyltransferase